MGNIKLPELSEVYHEPWEQSMFRFGRELGIFPGRFRLFNNTVFSCNINLLNMPMPRIENSCVTCISNEEWINMFNEARMRKAIKMLYDDGIIKPTTTEDWIYPLN